MGNGASTNPIAQAVAKNQMNSALGQAQDGFQASKKTEEQKLRDRENEQRAKTRVTDYEQKKKDREERKKKLKNQWGAHRKANT